MSSTIMRLLTGSGLKFRNQAVSSIGVVLMAVGAASAIPQTYLGTSHAARYALPAEIEDNQVAGNTALIYDEAASSDLAIQFGFNGKCIVKFDKELTDQAEETIPRSWPHATAKPATIYVETRNLSAEYKNYMNQAISSFNQLVPECMDVRAVATCPVTPACITTAESSERVPSASGGTLYGLFSGRLNSARDTLIGGNITLYSGVMAPLSSAIKMRVAFHELGHGLGLKHRATLKVLMYATTAAGYAIYPDQIDRANLFVLYGQKYETFGQVPAEEPPHIDYPGVEEIIYD